MRFPNAPLVQSFKKNKGGFNYGDKDDNKGGFCYQSPFGNRAKTMSTEFST